MAYRDHIYLWIDDQRNPPTEDQFAELGIARNCHFVVCRCLESAKKFLEYTYNLNDVARIYLDHDLGPDEDTMQLLKWAYEDKKMYAIDPAKVFFLTENVPGRDNMVSYLESAWKTRKMASVTYTYGNYRDGEDFSTAGKWRTNSKSKSKSFDGFDEEGYDS